jgi:acyl-CoA synthetase (AMP-forming)/AMP-acid ligase II
MKHVSESESLYECVYLAGHPALTASKSDEPPGSFHSKDVFTPHPTLPGRWKYMSMLDDRIYLINGEKVLPLTIEGCIKQHQLVHEAVVVGLGKAVPGLLILRSPEAEAENISDDEYLDSIWPIIQEANSHAEAFSRISRDLVAIMPSDAKPLGPTKDP